MKLNNKVNSNKLSILDKNEKENLEKSKLLTLLTILVIVLSSVIILYLIIIGVKAIYERNKKRKCKKKLKLSKYITR